MSILFNLLTLNNYIFSLHQKAPIIISDTQTHYRLNTKTIKKHKPHVDQSFVRWWTTWRIMKDTRLLLNDWLDIFILPTLLGPSLNCHLENINRGIRSSGHRRRWQTPSVRMPSQSEGLFPWKNKNKRGRLLKYADKIYSNFNIIIL